MLQAGYRGRIGGFAGVEVAGRPLLDTESRLSVIGLGRSAENAAFSCAVQVNVMTAVKTDRRTQRTRQALMMAFVGEVLTRGYEDVSVEDIVKRANIGRSTFYMHYKSKEDLLRESISRP